MKQYDLNPIIDNIRGVLATHKLRAGCYSRWLGEQVVNPYGCADAANILYSIGDFPRDKQERDAFVKTLQGMQGEDGLYHEHTHIDVHTTAHCLAALELFDATALQPCTPLLQYKDYDKLTELLDESDRMKYGRGHLGAGIYAIMNLTGEADAGWNDRYFRWFWDHVDPQTGLWNIHLCGQFHNDPTWHYMGDTFHYLFNHEHAHMPLRYPEKLIDTCISLWDTPGQFPENFGRRAHYLEIDWIYCMTRASRQTPYRFFEIRERLEQFVDVFYEYLTSIDWSTEETVNDIHLLFGAVCALAELQQTLPGKLISEKPLKLALDRRPFI